MPGWRRRPAVSASRKKRLDCGELAGARIAPEKNLTHRALAELLLDPATANLRRQGLRGRFRRRASERRVIRHYRLNDG